MGFREKIPQWAAGMRTLPPISLPMPAKNRRLDVTRNMKSGLLFSVPNGEPPAPIRHASPPEEPPGVRFLQNGFPVEPQIGLLQPTLQSQNIALETVNLK